MAAGANGSANGGGPGSGVGVGNNNNNSAALTPAAGGGGGGVNNSANTPNNNNNNANATPANKSWELSDYELHRTPQDAVQDGSEIAVSPRALHSELMCPICLDMLENTMTTKECLHRFCSECIITALRSGNKECPTCRKKLVSKRSLRPDPNFDALISKIYPSRDEYEAQQAMAMARLSKSHNQDALAKSIEEGMKAQSQLRKVPPKNAVAAVAAKSHQETPSSATSAVIDASVTTSTPAGGGHPHHGLNGNVLHEDSATPTNAIAGPNLPSAAKISRTDSSVTGSVDSSEVSEEITEVELVFKAHPEMLSQNLPSSPLVQTRYIKTTANASVEHLAKYLGMRLALDSCDNPNNSPLHNCTIYISPNGGNSFVNISQNQSLSSVCEKFWRFNKPLEMYYSWKKI